MVEYTTTPGDVEVGVEERMEVLVEKKSSTGWMWKVFGALLILALCLGGIQLFVWYWKERLQIRMESAPPEASIMTDATEKTDTHHSLGEIISKSKAVIHLEGNCDEGENPRLEWTPLQGQGFTQGGFHLVENKIIISQTGLYFIYSQVSFRVSCSDDEEGADRRFTPLSHRIWRFSHSLGSKVSLMSAVRSACQNSLGPRQGWYNTIYLGAVFQLNKGDKLWTETNQLSELDTDEGKNFFGAFAL